MRVGALIASAAMISFGVLQCGSNGTQHFDDDGGVDANLDSTSSAMDSNGPMFGDVNAEAAPICQGLQCQVVSCGGGTHTTITGTVYDPGGNNPLYNILVYIPIFPSDPLPAITHGMSCDTCAAKIDNAMATALTDADGNFTIVDAPVGANIPIVVQVGKWRREFTMTTVAQCVPNAYPNPNVPANRMRLPAKQSEGSMPLIGFSTGCDPMDDLFKKVGIDPSEFTAATGTGTVHVYQGNSSDFNPTGSTSAYTFWDSITEMEKYDIIINACECSPYPRDMGYANLDTYLNGGGRFFGSHYHINFFADSTAAADLKTAATWNEWGSCGTAPYDIDVTFPKGKAMADWMKNLFPTSTYGQVAITSGCMVEDMHAVTSGIAQQWIYEDGNKYPGYISINTPTTQMPANRCGRAVLTDLHVGTTSTTLEQQEAALEFMFFDLAACVQDDGTTPTPPVPN